MVPTIIQRDTGSNTCCNPKLDGELELEFAKWIDGVKQPGTDMIVKIKGLPGNNITTHKHYWIYSKEAGWGKSTTVEMTLVDHYSAHQFRDPNNALGVPMGVQWLVFDEYSGARTLSYVTLKNLTSGDASGTVLRRKRRRMGYVPSADVQVMILSSHSPYEVYGTWDPKKQKRVMSENALTCIHDRFHVHRLDGDNETERRKWILPTTWTRNDALAETRALFEPLLTSTKTVFYESQLLKVYETFLREIYRPFTGPSFNITDMKEFLMDALGTDRDLEELMKVFLMITLPRGKLMSMERQQINCALESVPFNTYVAGLRNKILEDPDNKSRKQLETQVRDRWLKKDIDLLISVPFREVSASSKLCVDDFLAFVVRVRKSMLDEREKEEWRQTIAKNPIQLSFSSFLATIQLHFDIPLDTWYHLQPVFYDTLQTAVRIIWPDCELLVDDDDDDGPASKRLKLEK